MNTQQILSPIIKAANPSVPKGAPGYALARAAVQLQYLTALFEENSEAVPEPILEEVGRLTHKLRSCGEITMTDTLAMEAALAEFSPKAKSITVYCVGHAHIDMNWMWGYPETVGITIDTFRTVLRLMREYPDFKFSQSQASTYEIIEKYAPSLLPEIKQRIHEGRWELTASQWVEGDKNMAGTESLCRHLLYTKEYLARLFDIDPDSLKLDFEPDTFGHNENMPEILSGGGVKYFYHCRGYKGEILYRWQAPSGAELLTFRDPEWYLTMGMDRGFCRNFPHWVKLMGVPHILWLYGVGDHGGGPTRRDIELITEMRELPLLPDLRFATMNDFYTAVEPYRAQLPVVRQELNCVFTGCYTSEARTKLYNRLGEDRLGDSEALCAMASIAGVLPESLADFREGWKNVLFNQFHDILPGSGVPETYRYAAGRFQDAMAVATGNANTAIHAITDAIDTSRFGGETDPESTAEGAGAGVRVMETPTRFNDVPSAYGFGETARGGGSVRPFVVLNPTAYDRSETAQLSLWDWQLAPEETELIDSEGNSVPFTVIHQDAGPWVTYGHKHIRMAFPCRVPQFGRSVYYVREAAQSAAEIPDPNPRVHDMADGTYVLENERLRAVFDTQTMAVISLTDKTNKLELLGGGGVFRLVQEQSNSGSAWTVGEYRRVEDINANGSLLVDKVQTEGVYKWIDYRLSFGRSALQVRVSLGTEEQLLRYDVVADWQEQGDPATHTPQLQFYAPVGYAVSDYRYDEAAGSIVRKAVGHDVPALSYIAANGSDGRSLFLTSNCKYGYRGDNNAVTVDLLRASYTPDRYPDPGYHQFSLGLGVTGSLPEENAHTSTVFSHALTVQPTGVHGGRLSGEGSFLKVTGCKVYGVKCAESGDGIVLRLGNITAEPSAVTVEAEGYGGPVVCDVTERRLPGESGMLEPYALRTEKIAKNML